MVSVHKGRSFPFQSDPILSLNRRKFIPFYSIKRYGTFVALAELADERTIVHNCLKKAQETRHANLLKGKGAEAECREVRTCSLGLFSL